MMIRHKRLWAIALLMPLALAACSSDDDSDNAAAGASAGAQTSTGTYSVVTHASAGDKFWDVVKNGAEQAGKDLGVTVKYNGNGDPAQQSQLIDAAVSEKVDGLVVSMANPDALKDSIEKAVAAGIPVITINSGGDKSAEFGALAHVGQTEGIAGRAAGTRLKEAGGTKLVCVIHEAGNIGLEERCEGAGKTFGNVENLQVDGTNLADVTSKVAAKLQSDASVDSVLTLNNGVAVAAVAGVQQAGRSIKLGTFDLDSDVITAIQDGSILFAVDQQQYLQGYLPIVMLNLYRSNGNTIGGGQAVLTGPGFVDKTNAAKVAEYAARGTR
jgi:simple sugar transport system substrate-binding protein